MDHLWSPWRYQYVSSAGAVPSGKDFCLFCQVAAGVHEDVAHLVVLRAERNFVLLNRYPYSTGHLMIAVLDLVCVQVNDTVAQRETCPPGLR